MRPKKTYLDDGKARQQPQHLSYWESEFAESGDSALPHELAMIVQDARASYLFKKQPAQDIKETLRGLSLMKDDVKIQQAAQMIDEFTKSHLCTAAGLIWREENPDADTTVPDELFTIKSWSAEHIQQMARYALKRSPGKSGRNPTQDRDVFFAARLATYWGKIEDKKATVTMTSETTKESAFVSFAVDMFHRAGRFVGSSALENILRQSIKNQK